MPPDGQPAPGDEEPAPSARDGAEAGPGRRPALGWGSGLALVLAGVVVLIGLPLMVTASKPLRLNRPDHGPAPVLRKVKSGGQESTEHRYLTWDVRNRAESTFRPGGPDRFGFRGRELDGELTFSVPERCADRRIRWEIRVDGDRAGGGGLRWLHTYKVRTGFAVERTPEAVTLLMRWDGGDADCPSFSAEWEDPLVSRDPVG